MPGSPRVLTWKGSISYIAAQYKEDAIVTIRGSLLDIHTSKGRFLLSTVCVKWVDNTDSKPSSSIPSLRFCFGSQSSVTSIGWYCNLSHTFVSTYVSFQLLLLSPWRSCGYSDYWVWLLSWAKHRTVKGDCHCWIKDSFTPHCIRMTGSRSQYDSLYVGMYVRLYSEVSTSIDRLNLYLIHSTAILTTSQVPVVCCPCKGMWRVTAVFITLHIPVLSWQRQKKGDCYPHMFADPFVVLSWQRQVKNDSSRHQSMPGNGSQEW